MQTIHLTPCDDLHAILAQAAPDTEYVLAPGIYRSKIKISTPQITLRGAGADETILIWDDYAQKLDEQGREYNTFRTYTVAVCADHVSMYDLAIVNDSLHPELKGQEVALSVVGDDFVMEHCRLTSTQDTLFAGPLPPDLIERYIGFLTDDLRRGGKMRQRYTECLIEGTIDFIFGCAEALFENCEIKSIFDVRGHGYAAAPAHTLEQTEGFVFKNCRFTCEKTVAPGSIYLARPWRDYGLSVFENCSYGPHIAEAGFDKWNDTDRDKTARFYESPSVAGRVAWVKKLD